MSLKDTILGSQDNKPVAVEVPEWETTVYIKVMSGAELDSWQVETYELNGKDVTINRQNIRCRLLVRCLTDETGKRIFSDADAQALGTKNTKVIERLYKKAEKLNAVTAKDIEDLAKNS